MMPGEYLKMTVEAYSVVAFEFGGIHFVLVTIFHFSGRKLGLWIINNYAQVENKDMIWCNKMRREAKNVLLASQRFHRVLRPHSSNRYATINNKGLPWVVRFTGCCKISPGSLRFSLWRDSL